jgi:SM-20-related protein
MTNREAAAEFDVLLIENFFDAPTRETVLADMRSSGGGPATVYGSNAAGSVDDRMRKATRLAVSPETADLVRRLLLERKRKFEEHFGVGLSDCEDPQFLRYDVGGFFVAHQDGNTGLLLLDSDRGRKISVVIFLSSQSDTPESGDYCGGSLVIYGQHGPARPARRARTSCRVPPRNHSRGDAFD